MYEPDSYSLSIDNITVDDSVPGKTEGRLVTVSYSGRRAPSEVSVALNSNEMPDILDCCQSIANEIFRSEFGFNSSVSLKFELKDDKGISIWHTSPNTYLRCPLNLTMNWSCDHLKKYIKSYVTLGMIEVPDEYFLEGNRLRTPDAVALVMDAMASGIEFMGSMFYMRDQMDHDRQVVEKAAAAKS